MSPKMIYIPGREEIARLPRWAAVAFAARCAKRVYKCWGNSQIIRSVTAFESRMKLQEAVSLVETCATRGGQNISSKDRVGRLSTSVNRISEAARDHYDTLYAKYHEVCQEEWRGIAFANIEAEKRYKERSRADAKNWGSFNARQVYWEPPILPYPVQSASLDAELAKKAHASILSVDCALRSLDAELYAEMAWKSAQHACEAAPYQDIAKDMRIDFHVLEDASRRKNWGNISAIPPLFFEYNSVFLIDYVLTEESSIESDVIRTEIYDYFRTNPERLYDLGSRQFELLVRDLFKDFGFEVELTKQTRDGGKDIVAVSHGSERYLIECKRFARHRKVGIAPVQRLYGVVHDEDDAKGILVTTSSFTKPAKNFLNHHKWFLKGVDHEELLEWLEMYQKINMEKYLRTS